MTFKLFPTLIVFALVTVGFGHSSQSALAQDLPPITQPDPTTQQPAEPTTNNQGSGDTDTGEGQGIGDLDDAN